MTLDEFINTLELNQRKEIRSIQWDLSSTGIHDNEDFPQKMYWRDAALQFAKKLNIDITNNENTTPMRSISNSDIPTKNSADM